MNSRIRPLRGSSSARCPINEKPWHGAPPNTTSMGVPFNAAASRIFSPVVLAASAQTTAQFGKLNSCTAQWIGSISTAAATSKLACSKPSDSPPAPANRSMPVGLFVTRSLPSIREELIQSPRQPFLLLQFALPDREEGPTHPFQLPLVSAIACHIRGKLRLPEFSTALG